MSLLIFVLVTSFNLDQTTKIKIEFNKAFYLFIYFHVFCFYN